MKIRLTPATLLATGLAVALWLLIVGGKLVVIDRYGSDVPEWDQWDAEGLAVLVPWKQGHLTLADLMRPHNEHRIFPTKVLGLAVVAINGQWDARLQCVINAGLHALLASGLFLAGRRLIEPRWHAPWFALLAATFALPLAWQNVLAGFHSQQVFLLGFTVVSLWLLPIAVAGSRRWWIGAAAAVLACLSMGSGFLAAAIVLVLVAYEVIRRRRSLADSWVTLGFCTVLVSVGWLTRVEVPYHASLKAQTVSDFLLSAFRSLRWPASGQLAWSLLIWMPWLSIVACHIRGLKQTSASGPLRLLGLGGWVALQILASAYARGAGGDEPASRYIDTLVLGLLANGLILGWWLSQAGIPRVTALIGRGIALAWAIAVVIGINHHARQSFQADLEGWVGAYHHEGDLRVRAYLATNNPAYLATGSIPYPGADSLRERLDRPELRAVLPATVQPGLDLRPSRSEGFVAIDARSLPYPAPEDAPTATPETPPLGAKLIWTSHGATGRREWESAPQARIGQGRIGLWLAGRVAPDGAEIAVLDARTRETLTSLPLRRARPGRWVFVSVPEPDRSYVLSVRVTDPASWVAFSQPVPSGRFSGLATEATRSGRQMALAGIFAALILGLGEWLRIVRARTQSATT